MSKPLRLVIGRDFIFQKLPNLEETGKPILEQRLDENKNLGAQVSDRAGSPVFLPHVLHP